MSFYEEIKERYKQNIDKETGLLKKQRTQLNGLIILMKSIALEQTDNGKCEFYCDFGCKNTLQHFIKGEEVIRLFDDSEETVLDYDIYFQSSDIYYLFEGTGLHETLMTEIRKAFGPEFTIDASIQSSEHRSFWLEVHASWPLPQEEK